MGQYYRAVNFTKKEALSPCSVGSLLKLMESAYVGNFFTEALYELLGDRWDGDEVAVVGDYAWDDGSSKEKAWMCERCQEDPYSSEAFKDVSFLWAMTPDESSEAFRSLARELGIPSRECETEKAALAAIERSLSLSAGKVVFGSHPAAPVLAEHNIAARIKWSDRRESIELFRIPESAPRYLVNFERHVYIDRWRQPVSWIRKGVYTLRYDALTLFLAVGNGLGGGDYRPENRVGLAQVGAWVGEHVGATKEPPAGFKEIASPFDEEGLFFRATDTEIEELLAEIPEDEHPTVESVQRAWEERQAN